MEENKDFVIDTGMPITPPAPENQTPEPQVVAPELQEENTLEVDSPIVEEPPVETQANEVVDEAASEEDKSSKEDEGLTLEDIAKLIETLQKKFDEKIAVDEHKNGLFNKLYKERDEYKNDLYGKLLKPFVTSCIRMINELRLYISRMDTYEVEQSLKYLKSVPDDIIEMLEENGVEVFTEEGDSFNPRTQRAKKIVPTQDASQNNLIVERLEKGFRWNGVVLQPEMVAVYRKQ